MKILIVCQYYYPEPFRITDIAENLVKLGNEVTILTGLPNYPEGKVSQEYKWGKRRNEFVNGVEIVRTFIIGRRKGKIFLGLNYISFIISSSLKMILLKKDFDTIFVYQLSPVFMAIPGILYKKIRKKKLVLYCLDIWPASLTAMNISKKSFIYKIVAKMSSFIYSNVDSLLVSSKGFVKYLNNELRINKDIKYLPQYAEDIYGEVTDENKSIEEYNLVFAGNVGKMQSVDTIVKTASFLKEKQNIKFHIVGDGSELQKCKNLANQLGCGNIYFHGRVELKEVIKFYDIADVLLLTLRDDDLTNLTLPAKYQSYLLANKRIIAAANGETAEEIKCMKAGNTCSAENSDELSSLILNEYTNSYECNNREIYMKHYSKEKFLMSLLHEFSK
ncbi:MAG: glycosyltransferase family 4 protein [Bacilli bacterium]